MENTVIAIAGMSCEGCVRNIAGVLRALPGVVSVDVSLAANEARVGFEPTQIERKALLAAIEDAGFDAS